jgi:predicted CopG family antitoxin
MVQSITISEESYVKLIALKRKAESFSDLLDRLADSLNSSDTNQI